MWGDPIGAAALNQPVVNVDNHNNNNDTSPNRNSNTKTTINTENLNKNQKKCLSSIYQITGPAHIPTSDIRWQELFLSYDILVHLDRGHIHDCNSNSNSNRNMTMMDQVCHSMAKHARNSSNLAGFAWHLTKMMNEFMTSCKECSNYNSTGTGTGTSVPESAPESAPPMPVPTSSSSMGQSQNRNANANSHTYTNAATAKIAMVGKARVVCGILNLFRIICHEVIIASLADVDTDTDKSTNNNTSGNGTGSGAVGSSSTSSFTSTSTSSYEFLQETFTYKSRQKESEGLDMDTSSQLLSTLLSFISMMGSNHGTNNNMDGVRGNGDDNVNGHGNGNGANRAYSCMPLLNTVPELYDATVLSLMLISVLYSTQLYQPLLSSFELRDELYNNHNNTNNNGHIHGHHGHGDTNQNGNHNHNTSTAAIHRNFFLDHTMQQAYEKRQKINNTNQNQNNYHHYTPSYNIHTWSSQSILSSCLNWIIQRPSPPERSIAAHFRDMVDTVAHDVKNEKVGSDGMFENHAIVMSRAPLLDDEKFGDDGKESEKNGGNGGTGNNSRGKNGRGGRRGRLRRHRSAPMVILDATNKVIHLSSSLLMLPFRLMTLALRALGHPESFLLGGSKGSGEGFDDIKLAQLQAAYGARGGGSDSIASPTNDVLWLSDSPIADLGNTLFLILSNNYRASSHSDTGGAGDCSADYYFINNAFRSELASLDDNRWDGWKSSGYSVNDNTYLEDASSAFESVDLSSNGGTNGSENNSLLSSSKNPKQKRLLTTNFEHLFQSFGGTLHNELGALTLYTLLQSSPIFTASLAVRTDLDMLVLPLLRTLYFSSSVNHHIAGRTTTSSAKKTPNGKAIANSSSSVQVSENPFRSQSQLYVIMILLLIFSQDTSFGPDSFRRSNISVVVWYKERSLKNISLGSMIVLSLLRSITFNLNRMQDPFLLSNCCAVLLNLSPHIVNLHSYASMRLASVLVSSMKRYTVLVMKNGGKPAEEGDVSSLLGMYAETCRILLQVVKHCIRRRVVEKNLHLVYSLVYNQRDLNTVLKAKKSPFKPSDTEKITALIKKADTLIENSSARTAEKTMEVLEKSTGFLKGSKSSGKSNARMISSSASTTDESTISTSSSTVSGMEDFRFTYEEEADPEIFFVPYLWEIVVCCVSASTLEWNKRRIKVFALLEHAGEDIQDSAADSNTISGVYGKDVEDLV